jgi:hypothetical protein
MRQRFAKGYRIMSPVASDGYETKLGMAVVVMDICKLFA